MKKKARRTLDRKLALAIPNNALAVVSGGDASTGTLVRSGVENVFDA